MTCPSDKSDEFVLKLNKSLYGLHQAPLSWFAHLKQHLENHGFRSSSIDQCLFYNKQLKAFCLVYIDDEIWVAPNTKTIHKVLESLQDELEITIEGDATAFLGIQYDHLSNGEI